ncbi:MAG: hypothetical protein AB1422_02790 [bacterium]
MKNNELFDLARRLVKLNEEAKKPGIFTGDRELLECPKNRENIFSCPNCGEVIALEEENE